MPEIVIGTANFGNDYGILNQARKGQYTLESSKAFEIIKYCTSVGIKKFDTALTYGDASNILEKYLELENEIEIFHKITWTGGSQSDYEEYQRAVKALMERPIGSAIRLVQWHNWNYDGTDLLKLASFQNQCLEKYTFDFGVTTYGADCAIHAASSALFAKVQFEYNILNQDVIRALIELQPSYASQFSIRSILLQGLLADNNPLPSKLPQKLIEAVETFKSICKDWSLSSLEVALRSKLNFKLDTDLVIGVTSPAEIDQILFLLEKGALPNELFQDLMVLNQYDASVADPRLWNLG